jgi:hypothetical protein
MSSGTVPIQACDSERGCDAWEIDLESTGARYVYGKSPLDGWVIDRRADTAFCPEHKGEAS